MRPPTLGFNSRFIVACFRRLATVVKANFGAGGMTRFQMPTEKVAACLCSADESRLSVRLSAEDMPWVKFNSGESANAENRKCVRVYARVCV